MAAEPTLHEAGAEALRYFGHGGCHLGYVKVEAGRQHMTDAA